ncbi:MAG: cytidine deaminase [Myxococcales bacterium]|nr:cytidine deaminase [Myxococcota bacterium]MDW8282647.1 cytidine deaminase [Myxococcales bacterium]
MPEDLEELAARALAAREAAYAPYSRFLVGAAVRTRDGRMFAAGNVENASYGLTLCAERGAILQAVSAGIREIVALAVATATSPPTAPCGACRQVLAEFAADDCPVLLVNLEGEKRLITLGDLLPYAFRPSDLGATFCAEPRHGRG